MAFISQLGNVQAKLGNILLAFVPPQTASAEHMDVQWIDNFDHIDFNITGATLDTQLKEKYESASVLDGVDASSYLHADTGATQLRFGQGTSQHVEVRLKDNPANNNRVTMGALVRLPVQNNNAGHVFGIYSDARQQFGLRISTGGRLQVHVGTAFFSAIQKVIPAMEWVFIEASIKVSDTNGEIEVRVNDETVYQELDIDTAVSFTDHDIDYVRFLSSGYNKYTLENNGSGGLHIADTYVAVPVDDNLAFLGPIKVVRLLPNGNTADADFSLSGGVSGFLLVDDPAQHDADSTYIESTTSAHVSLFDLTASTDSPDDRTVLQLNTVARGDEDIIDKIKTGGTEFDGTTHTLVSGNYENYFSIFAINPDTDLAWTGTDLDSLQAGAEVS